MFSHISESFITTKIKLLSSWYRTTNVGKDRAIVQIANHRARNKTNTVSSTKTRKSWLNATLDVFVRVGGEVSRPCTLVKLLSSDWVNLIHKRKNSGRKGPELTSLLRRSNRLRLVKVTHDALNKRNETQGRDFIHQSVKSITITVSFYACAGCFFSSIEQCENISVYLRAARKSVRARLEVLAPLVRKGKLKFSSGWCTIGFTNSWSSIKRNGFVPGMHWIIIIIGKSTSIAIIHLILHLPNDVWENI